MDDRGLFVSWPVVRFVVWRRGRGTVSPGFHARARPARRSGIANPKRKTGWTAGREPRD